MGAGYKCEDDVTVTQTGASTDVIETGDNARESAH
jgi:hypothetical protein